MASPTILDRYILPDHRSNIVPYRFSHHHPASQPTPQPTQTNPDLPFIKNVHRESPNRKVRAHGRIRDPDPLRELVRQRPSMRGLGRKPLEPSPLDRLCPLRRVPPSEREKDLPAVCRRGTRSREGRGAQQGWNARGGLGGEAEERGQDAGCCSRVGCRGWAGGIVARGIVRVELAWRFVLGGFEVGSWLGPQCRCT